MPDKECIFDIILKPKRGFHLIRLTYKIWYKIQIYHNRKKLEKSVNHFRVGYLHIQNISKDLNYIKELPEKSW
jgi:hypothetical protein